MLPCVYRATLFAFLFSFSSTTSVRSQLVEQQTDMHAHLSSHDDTDIALPTGEFTVQIGAFSNKANAERLSRRFRLDGWNVDLYKNVLDRKKTFYLVWIGSYDSLEEAHRQQILIEERYKIHGVIRQRTGWKN